MYIIDVVTAIQGPKPQTREKWQRHSPVGQPRSWQSCSSSPSVSVYRGLIVVYKNWKLQLPPAGCSYRFRLLVHRDDLWSLANPPSMLPSKNTGFRLLFGSSWCCFSRVLAARLTPASLYACSLSFLCSPISPSQGARANPCGLHHQVTPKYV